MVTKVMGCDPIEVIVIGDEIEDKQKKLLDACFDLTIYRDDDRTMHRLDYQNELLGKVWGSVGGGGGGMLSMVEVLNLEFFPFGRIALCFALAYAYEHDKHITYRLQKPIVSYGDLNLVLTKYAPIQLQIFPEKKKSNGIVSLECVVNKCQTSMGRRELNQRLHHPLTNPESLEERYRRIQYFYDKVDVRDKVLGCLENLKDIERLHRKMILGIIKPFELAFTYGAYDKIKQIATILGCSNIWNVDVMGIRRIQTHYDNSIHIEANELTFKPKYCTIYDALLMEKQTMVDEMQAITRKIERLLLPKSVKLSVEHNDKMGHFIRTTALRAKTIKKAWDTTEDELSIHSIGSSTKISTTKFNEASNKLIQINEALEERSRVLYERFLKELVGCDDAFFVKLTKVVADIDVSLTGARIAVVNRYCRPKLVVDKCSFVEADSLRHPISEIIHNDILFVPNDVDTKTKKGMVLTGMNGAGKSVYMKSVGLSIVMAQTGLFVPATKYTYSPFNKIMTRIGNGDNLLQGHSTFVCEMLQLREILQQANASTFVIADELCAGSEVVSATAILASTIVSLSKKKCNFIASTHIHGLQDILNKRETQNVTFAYIDVEMDGLDITYTRKLRLGVSNTLYGLEVCRYLIDDEEFISRASRLRKKVVGRDVDKLVQTRRSKYNKKVVVDHCEICGTQTSLDVHHIKFQSTADGCGYIGNYHKNVKGNLVVLCKEHHNLVHDQNITINGWKMSAKNGRFLDFVQHQVANY